ncbi:stage II sporulation protein P [Brevibacillus sp. H7]|jgi:stage II sporulation protein P|uniref:stage II sporulation protein P n=1 Tax=Brevibacillus sp. H7 TaxID=3349138 RepID=UPI003825C0E7
MATLIQRQFVLLSFVTAFLFVVTGFLAIGGNRIMIASSTIQQATSHISGLVLVKLMGQEIPALSETVKATNERETNNFASFMFELVTSIHPGDLRSLLGRELPGLLTIDDARFIVAGKDTTLADLYVEYPAAPREEIEVPPAAQPTDNETVEENPKTDPVARPTTNGKKIVFVYHTHNRESWLSEAKLEPETKSVNHETRNITLVGRHLAQALNDKGIGTEVNTDDIYSKTKFWLSYAESLKVVKAATERNREIRYFFDLHRDDKPRERTTITINGKSYARTFFVIGLRNKNHEKNTQFAKELHQLLEKKYPGLSRGITAKNEKSGNGEYNQSISPGSMLIEIGGIENTLQECYNTAEALADVFAEYYWQAERVNKPESAKPAMR